MDSLDSLDDAQREMLSQFQAITNTEDLDTAVVLLNSTSWDLESAITKIYDRPVRNPSASSAAADHDGTGRPLMEEFGIDESDVMPPSGAGHAPGGSGPLYWLKRLFALPISIVSWPLGIFYGAAGIVLGFVARLLRIRPGLNSLRPRNPFLRDPNSSSARRRQLDPTAAAERWVRALEELTGSRPPAASLSSAIPPPLTSSSSSTSASASSEPSGSGSGLRARESRAVRRVALPEFFVGGYEDLLRKGKEELRIIMVVLTCEEHEDDADFKRNVLTDPDLLRALANEKILCWGGDVRERDAYQVSKTLQPFSLPFVSFVSLQPTSRSPSSSPSPRMAPLTRHEGSPSSTTSAQSLLSALTTIVLPRATPFLTRLRNQETTRRAERRIREEQDRAFAAAAKKDTDRVLKRRKEEEEKRRSEAKKGREEEEKKAREEERRRVRGLAKEWREWQRGALADSGEAGEGEGVRVGVRLGDGRRVVRRFRADDRVERVYAWVECMLGEPGDAKEPGGVVGRGTRPRGYEHVYEYRLATTFPRVLIEVDGSAANEDVDKAGGGVLKVGANLVVEGLEKRRESLGEVGSDESDEEEEEEEDE